jgi:hypothetical protein
MALHEERNPTLDKGKKKTTVICSHLARDQYLAYPLGILCRDLFWLGAPMIERIGLTVWLVYAYAIALVLIGQPIWEISTEWIAGRQRLVLWVLEYCFYI